MKLPWKREARPIRQPINSKVLELQTAKEILAEVFHARPTDVEEMIKRRLEEKESGWDMEEKLWPAAFCLGE